MARRERTGRWTLGLLLQWGQGRVGDRAWTKHVGQSHGAGRWERAPVLDKVLRRDLSKALKGTRAGRAQAPRPPGR